MTRAHHRCKPGLRARLRFILRVTANVVACFAVVQLSSTTASFAATGDHARVDSLRARLTRLVAQRPATIGIAVKHLERGDSLVLGGAHRYPMQSVYKFPLAMAVLERVDKGALRLDQKVHVGKRDLHVTWSPLRDEHPDGNIDVTVRDLLRYTVSKSDNNTCDILFGLVHGPREVEKFVRRANILDMAIVATEAQMHRTWKVQYTNCSTPQAMLQLLETFHRRAMLSDSSGALLRTLMEETSTGPLRIKGLLPPGTVVAHKTGSSGANDDGLTAATNDVGIITLPDGSHVALVVFVSDSRLSNETNERIIAEIARIVYDTFSGVHAK